MKQDKIWVLCAAFFYKTNLVKFHVVGSQWMAKKWIKIKNAFVGYAESADIIVFTL